MSVIIIGDICLIQNIKNVPVNSHFVRKIKLTPAILNNNRIFRLSDINDNADGIPILLILYEHHQTPP